MKKAILLLAVVSCCALIFLFAVLLAFLLAPISALAAFTRTLGEDMGFAFELTSQFWRDWT
ncbi:hypothetical protein [uncultured Croceicoccus sp.]|uniref:hypothetical protein n=1 Tax=uncultured Croceicoccus sp. TaxID=1295329 RepID=UPI0026319F54|nr:hypothetical protein [uncultured Croceicoccus sp.]